MTQSEVSWQQLNAYVDGELSAREKAAVAEDIASDPSLARAVAVLQGVKAELAEFPDTAPVRRRRGGRFALPFVPWLSAACIALLVAGGAVLATQLTAPETPSLLAQHQQWTETARAGGAPTPETGVSRAFFAPQLPSLTPFGLRLDHAALVSLADGEEALHAGYVGQRGCRISLFLLPPESAADAPGRSADVLQASGQAGPWRYHLLAQDMESARFALIAAALDEQLQLVAPLSEESRLAYEDNPAARAPCFT
ncbi:MAG: hypothetical protein AAFW98_10850 [Pseudomonadota bacterium]